VENWMRSYLLCKSHKKKSFRVILSMMKSTASSCPSSLPLRHLLRRQHHSRQRVCWLKVLPELNFFAMSPLQ
ncbi:hypothetical protein QTG54_001013, partial [Skeletonema marinoi]